MTMQKRPEMHVTHRRIGPRSGRRVCGRGGWAVCCLAFVSSVVGVFGNPATTGVFARDDSAGTSSAGNSVVSATAPTTTSADGRPHGDAMAFAAEHHPELAELLDQLRAGDPRAYAEAIADIERTLERLGRMRERQPERYAAAIEDWKLSSRIRLVLARMALSKDPLAAAELEDLVRARQEVRLTPLRSERDRLEKRLEKIGATLVEYDRDPEAAVERECRDLLRRAVKPAGGKLPSSKSEESR